MKSEQEYVSAPFGDDGPPSGMVCRWDSPDGTLRVALGSSLVRELWQSAIQAFLSLPRRGVETGGLLFGQVRREQGVAVFEIAAFEDIPCEHRFGPAYLLDEPDRQHLGEVMARHRRDGSAPVIGFYRSYTGREAQLDEADRELLREFFPQRHFVCLMLQPLSADHCSGNFEFLTSSEAPVEAAPVPVPVLLPEAPRIAEPVVSEAPPPAPDRTRLLAILCCILGAIACFAIYQWWRASRTPVEAAIHLDAVSSAVGLQLNWDANSPATLQATRGVLTVNDGNRPGEIPLSADQLRSGSFQYSPTSGNVLLRLRLYNPKGLLAGDSLRVIRPAAPVTTPVAPPPATASSPEARREVQPIVPASIRRRIHTPIVVPVEVSVNASGRVTRATSNVSGPGLERYLAGEAVKAARKWSFRPPRSKNGTAVASTTTITFEFKPK